MIHLTATGPNAGTPFCGCNKAIQLLRGDTFAHVPYTNADAFVARLDVCPACRAAWDEAGEPEPKPEAPTTTKYVAQFYGKTRGAIGISYYIDAETEGVDARAAYLKLYDTYDHIERIKLYEVSGPKAGRLVPPSAYGRGPSLPRYFACPHCEASFKESLLDKGAIPRHHWRGELCPGIGAVPHA